MGLWNIAIPRGWKILDVIFDTPFVNGRISFAWWLVVWYIVVWMLCVGIQSFLDSHCGERRQEAVSLLLSLAWHSTSNSTAYILTSLQTPEN